MAKIAFYTLTTIAAFIFWGFFSNDCYCKTKKPGWHVRHFPNAPRITPEQAKNLYLTTPKIIVIGVPWTKKGWEEKHICGAIRTNVNADVLDRLIKKIPKEYIILSY